LIIVKRFLIIQYEKNELNNRVKRVKQMSNFRRTLFLIGISLGVFLLSHCESDDSGKAQNKAPVANDLKSLLKANKVIVYSSQEKAIPFKLKTLDGKTMSLADHKGKVIFLNFWATWCKPCLLEMPAMEKLYQTMKGKDFIILAISSDEDLNKIRETLNRLKPRATFPILLKDNDVQTNYRVGAIPVTYLIGKDGKIIGKVIREHNWSSPEAIQLFNFLVKQ